MCSSSGLLTTQLPHIIFTLGVYRSASTWLVNVVAEIAKHSGGNKIVYADLANSLAEHLKDAETIVVKSHYPDSALQLIMKLSGAPLIVSVREPLDCVVSYMQTFGSTFDHALYVVAASAERTLSTLTLCEALIIRYEDPDARGTKATRLIAEHIGADLPDAEARRITDKFSAASVNQFIADLIAADHFGPDPQPQQFDPVTHWHPSHLGSGASGRFEDALSPDQISQTLDATREFREALGYGTLRETSAAGGSPAGGHAV